MRSLLKTCLVLVLLTSCTQPPPPVPAPAPVTEPPPVAPIPPPAEKTYLLGPQMDLGTTAILEVAPGKTERLHIMPESGQATYNFAITPRDGKFTAKAYALQPQNAEGFDPQPLADTTVAISGIATQELTTLPTNIPDAIVILELTNPGTLPLNLKVAMPAGTQTPKRRRRRE